MIEICRIINLENKLEDLGLLLHDFRQELASLKMRKINYTLADAKQEWKDYSTNEYEIYLAQENNISLGYAILRIFDQTVWLEQIYLSKQERRKGYATKLLEQANRRANDFGKETAFINVHPNNHKMIKFLAKNGYEVLNLIEVRKLYNKEKISTTIQVGDNSFLY